MTGVLQGDAPGLGGEARGGRAELVSVAVSPWTRLSRKPEKRVFLSAAWEHLGALCLSLSFSDSRAKPPPEMPEQLYAFTQAGVSGGGGGSSAQLGRWRSVSYLGSPVRAGAGRRRATQIPVALMVSAPLGNSSNSSSETWSILPWLFGTGGGACALVDFSSRVFFSNEAGFRGKLLSRLSLIRDRGSGTCPGAGPALLPGSGPAAPERGASVGRTVSGIRSLHRRPLCRGPGQSRPRESSSEWPASEEVCRDKWVGTKMASASWPCNNSEPLSSQVE